jgi:fibronectin type 3 domain-containing protein
MTKGSLARSVSLIVLGLALTACGGQKRPAEASSARPGAHSVTITWDASKSSVLGYRIYRATNPNEVPALLAVVAADKTEYTDRLVESGRTYSYVVTAFSSANTESDPSKKVSVTIPSP